MLIDLKKQKHLITILFAIALTMFCASVKAQIYLSGNVKTVFFSATPIEDIKAASNRTSAVLVSKTGEFAFQVAMKSFEFEKKMMQQHFNEDYAESDKYPNAYFKGTIEPKIDWSRDGTYEVTARGILNVHGVSRPRALSAQITINDESVTITSAFDVACADHDIKIPTIVFAKIAKIINVKVSGILIKKK